MMKVQSRIAALGEMIGNIAHQWRQPLNSIKAITSGVRLRKKLGRIDDKEIDESLGKIVEYTDYLSETIDDFRYFFVRDRKQETFMLKEVVERAISLASAAIKENKIELSFECAAPACELYGYPTELSQVFLNILNNARDVLIDKDEALRQIRIRQYQEDGICVVTFCDSGGGIDEAIAAKIFDPYFTTKHKAQGTGIGLYMSRQIVEKHFGGRLEFQNEEMQVGDTRLMGACFIVRIPIENVSATDINTAIEEDHENS
jgi:signal transduction histidine kinase